MIGRTRATLKTLRFGFIQDRGDWNKGFVVNAMNSIAVLSGFSVYPMQRDNRTKRVNTDDHDHMLAFP